MKTGLSLFWRVLVVQMVVTLIFTLLTLSSSIYTDLYFARYKLSMIQTAFAIIVFASLYFSKNGLVFLAWGERLGIEDALWRKFTKTLAVVMLLLACSNLIAIHFLSWEQWLTFKLSVPLLTEILFCLTIPLFLRMKVQD